MTTRFSWVGTPNMIEFSPLPVGLLLAKQRVARFRLTQHPMQLQIASQVIKRFFAPNVDKSVRLTVEFTILRETLETHTLYDRVNSVLEEIGGPNITRVVNERFDTPQTKTPPDSPFGRNSTATNGQQPES